MEPPFLTHLTLFQSRLGVLNIVLPLMGYIQVSRLKAEQKIAKRLEERREIDVATNQSFVEYLVSKKFVSAKVQEKSKYSGIRLRTDGTALSLEDKEGRAIVQIKALEVDIWMADHRIASNTATPTPENSGEYIDLATNLGFLLKTKLTWTGGACAVQALRSLILEPNPFLLGPEGALFIRHLLEKDGMMLSELVNLVQGKAVISRDDASNDLHLMILAVQKKLKERGSAIEIQRTAREFSELVGRTTRNRDKMSSAPGVLEHRTVPRLEWLTDIGCLSKPTRAKNGFEYTVTEDAKLLQSLLLDLPFYDTDNVAIQYWRKSRYFDSARSRVKQRPLRTAVYDAYKMMRRTIGPTSMKEISFIAAILSESLEEPITIDQKIVEWASENSVDIKLSGGRFRRGPEMVYISDKELNRI